MFKHIRSFVGKLFNENQQMLVVMYLSHFYWFLLKFHCVLLSFDKL